MHQQSLQDQNNGQTQRPHSSNGSPHNCSSAPALPLVPSNILSPTSDQTQNIEAENTPSSISIQDNFPAVDSLNIPSQLHPSINLDGHMPDPAAHAGLLYYDIQTLSLMPQYPTESDPVDLNLDVFIGLGNGIDDWEGFFNPPTKGQLSTEGYLTPFYDSQPLPFEYAAS
ncbi:hypothetical protein BDW75DRAFT_225372 [Aspergillus navahoensis]